MGAVDPGVVGQGEELLQAAPHLRRGALEQPAAAEREQRVAAEQRLGRREPEGDMAARMARHVAPPRRLAADIDALVIADGDVDAGDEIGSASCREQVCQSVESSVGTAEIKKK